MTTTTNAIDIPPEDRRVGASRMGTREKVHACWLALRAGYPINRATWGYIPETDQVVVDVPRLGCTFGVPFAAGTEATLVLIGERFGEAKLAQAREAVGLG